MIARIKKPKEIPTPIIKLLLFDSAIFIYLLDICFIVDSFLS